MLASCWWLVFKKSIGGGNTPSVMKVLYKKLIHKNYNMLINIYVDELSAMASRVNHNNSVTTRSFGSQPVTLEEEEE